MSRRGYRRPPDVPAEIRKAGRSVERGAKQAKEDIVNTVRRARPAVAGAVRSVSEGVRKIKRATKR